MKKIKIFIGSSIDDLAFERRDLVSFIAELNNKYIDRGIYIEPYICEEKSNEMRLEGSQKMHDDYIKNNADAMIFMFFKKAGKYTLRELQIAKETLVSENRKPYIFIYFKTINNDIVDTEEIRSAIDKIAGEYAHYYKRFSEADTIKLELLQYLSEVLSEGSLSIHDDGKIYVGNAIVNDIDISKIFAFQNNSELCALKKELGELEKQIQECVETRNWSLFEILSERRRQMQSQCSNLESEILKMLQFLFNSLKSGSINPIRLNALRLLEVGKYKEALSLLPIDVIASKSNVIKEKKALLDAQIKQEANEVLQDGITRLHALYLDDGIDDVDTKIEETYDLIVDMALIVGNSKILIQYADFLQDRNAKKALYISRLIEKNFDNFNDIDLYTKYDTYCMLAELSECEKEAESFSALAKGALLSYMGSINKDDWKTYIDTCERILDLFLEPEEIFPFLINSVEILEAHQRTQAEDIQLFLFYHTIATFHSNTSSAVAEEYYIKALNISEYYVTTENIYEMFRKKLAGDDCKFFISAETMFWQKKNLLAIKSLYQIKPEFYEELYVQHLFIIAAMEFVNNHYGLFRGYLQTVSQIIDKKSEYEDIQQFIKKLNID